MLRPVDRPLRLRRGESRCFALSLSQDNILNSAQQDVMEAGRSWGQWMQSLAATVVLCLLRVSTLVRSLYRLTRGLGSRQVVVSAPDNVASEQHTSTGTDSDESTVDGAMVTQPPLLPDVATLRMLNALNDNTHNHDAKWRHMEVCLARGADECSARIARLWAATSWHSNAVDDLVEVTGRTEPSWPEMWELEPTADVLVQEAALRDSVFDRVYAELEQAEAAKKRRRGRA